MVDHKLTTEYMATKEGAEKFLRMHPSTPLSVSDIQEIAIICNSSLQIEKTDHQTKEKHYHFIKGNYL